MVTRELILIFKEIVRPREFTFEGIIQPSKVRRRLRLAGGLIKDVAVGKLSKQTREDLVEEVRDSILQSPFLKPFVESEQARLRRLAEEAEGRVTEAREDIERRSREIEAEAREAAEAIEKEIEKAIREARKRAGV